MDKTSFDLEATSAAIIFNQDMSVEMILPRMSDEETIDFESNQNIFVAMAITSLVDDPNFRQFVGTKMQTMLETADALREDAGQEEAPICSPNSCPGSCCGTTEKDPEDGS